MSNGMEHGPFVEDVTEEQFEARVLERSREVPVVVDFWAEWCGPCRILGPVLEKLAAEYGGRFVLAKVDTDRAQLLARTFGVRGIPAVMAFRNGELVAQFTGALPEEAVRQFLDKVCPSDADLIFDEAEVLRTSDVAGAEAKYKDVLSMDDGHEGARVALAEIALERGDREEASRLSEGLEPLGPFGERIAHIASELALQDVAPDADEADLRAKLEETPDDAETLLLLGKVLASRRRYEEALGMLLAAAQADRALADGPVKELMVEIFHAVGIRSPLADDYRTRLSRLLY